MSELRNRKPKQAGHQKISNASSPKVYFDKDLVTAVITDERVTEHVVISDYFLVLITFVLSFLLRFFRLDWPGGVVFDETHFGRFTNQYHAGNFVFDIHPPLGKLVFYWISKAFSYNHQACAYQAIHDQFGEDCKYMILRSVAASFGMWTPLLLYFVVRNFGGGKWAAFFASILLNFDMLNLMESRFILMDSQLMFWSTSSLLVAQIWWKNMNRHFLAQDELKIITLLRSKVFSRQPKSSIIAKERLSKEERHLQIWENNIVRYKMSIWKRLLFILLVAITCSSAISIKWTALVTPGMVAIISFFGFKPLRKSIPMIDLVCILLISASLYILWFIVHFHLVPYSGDGDVFMARDFQRTLIGSPDYDSLATRPSLFSLIVYLNKEMFTANAGITARHDWESWWYEWPLNLRGLLFYVHKNEENTDEGIIYLLGNPFVIWAVTLVVAITCFGFLAQALVSTSSYLAGDYKYVPSIETSPMRHSLPSPTSTQNPDESSFSTTGNTGNAKINTQQDIDKLIGLVLKEKVRAHSHLGVLNIIWRRLIRHVCPYDAFHKHVLTVDQQLSQIIHNSKTGVSEGSDNLFARYETSEQSFSNVLGFCIIAYWLNLLPYIMVARSAFAYHYMPALLYGEIIFSLGLERCVHKVHDFFSNAIEAKALACRKKYDSDIDDASNTSGDVVSTTDLSSNNRKPVDLQKEHWTGFTVLGITFLFIIPFFVYFSPFIYGFVLTQEEIIARRWLPRWD